MRYISFFIGGVLTFSACHEAKFVGMGGEAGEVLTAGFRDTLITVFENAGTGKLAIDFSQASALETKVTVAVTAEENMQENKDYFITAKEIVVAEGEKSVDVEYALVDNNEANDSRSFTLKLMSLNGGIIDEQRADVKVKVLDDESEIAVGFKNTEMTVPEREPGSQELSYVCEIPVEISGTLNKPIQFKVSIQKLNEPDEAIENVHFRLTESVFVVSDATDIVFVPVEIINDDEIAGNRVFVLDITEVVGAGINTAQKRCTVTIEDDDVEVNN